MPSGLLVRLPDDLDLRNSALIEPTAVAVRDVRRSELTVGDHSVVLGGGPIGVLMATVARHAGAHVIVAEVDAGRRTRVAELGFEVVDPSQDDVVADVEKWTNGTGADVVFEVSGAAAAVRLATSLPKVRGTIVIVAIHAAPREIDLQRVFWRELRLLGARVYRSEDVHRAVKLVADGTIPADFLITGTVPLEETGQAIQDLSGGDAMKILVDAQAGGTR